jgi:hypothetical protein
MTKKQILDLNKLVPGSLKNETLTSLVSNLFNRFVSEERSVNVDGRIGKPVTGDANIAAPTLDREQNALIPALYFKNGSEENIFMFDDMLNKLKVLNADVSNLDNWMAEQSFNFTSPISVDKLINYANYYWVLDRSLTPSIPAWNKKIVPEYYVIQRPDNDSTQKLPVILATTRPINKFLNDRPPEQFTVTFTSVPPAPGVAQFTITSNHGTVFTNTNTLSSSDAFSETNIVLTGPDSGTDTVWELDDPDLIPEPLCSFTITNGYVPFTAGDSFTVDITYFTSEIYIAFNSPNQIGKGTINGVVTEAKNMYIDGVKIMPGNRILVWQQGAKQNNGIYTVSASKKWVRTDDATLESNFPLNMTVYVESGTLYGGKSFVLTNKQILGTNPDGSVNSKLFFELSPVHIDKQVNQWQEFNLWQHRDDLLAKNISIDSFAQAKRPIIEYFNTVEMNTGVINSEPVNSVNNYQQQKTRFNQIPQFNLYRYDGTYHGATSGLFFYVEDPDFDTDPVLLKKIKVTSDADYIFGTGTTDSEGRLLYYSQASELKSVWQAGPTVSTVSNITFNGGADKGSLVVSDLDQITDNQTWTLTNLSPTTFSVVGTRSGQLGNLTVGTPFVADDLTLTINDGLNQFSVNESFTFKLHSPIAPRYVRKDNDGNIVNYIGGVAGDATDGLIDGTWLNPLRMFQNLERETRQEITNGDLLNHVRSVIKNQNGFTGTSFGNNNVRSLNYESGLGGTIREYSSNFPLLASMLIQRDVSPLTIIDFAERQYMSALSSIDQFIINELANYLATVGVVTSSVIDPNAPDIVALSNYFESLRSEDVILRDTFSGTTAKVTNWPATLPMIGLAEAVVPSISFDYELGINIIVHHDGHISPIAVSNPEFDRTLVKSIVGRSDGAMTAGIFSETAPMSAYARQLWMKSSTLSVSIFDVIDDSDTPINGAAGDFWFKKSTSTLYEWDVVSNLWLVSGDSIASRWIPIKTDAIRNSLVLSIENKLYASVHPSQQINLDLTAARDTFYSQLELARFSAKNNYDTFAPDYISTDAFTWNYKQAVIPGIAITPARWYDIYAEYFNNPGVTISTVRPNLEPWKLVNFNTKPGGWDAAYKCTNQGSANVTANVKVVAQVDIAVLFGLQTIDGVSLVAGDRVLLTAQSLSQFNGLYTVSSTGWARTSDVLTNQLTVPVTSGSMENTCWSITTPNPFVTNIDSITFEQVRMWSTQMWLDIKSANPALKLCVNINNDSLIPPYVSSTKFYSSDALLTSIPNDIDAGYIYGDNGPIELVWSKSIEYLYSLARSMFRISPLEFLDKSWGETYMQVGTNARVERNLMSPLPSSKFLLHGERLNIVNSYSSQEIFNRINASAGIINWVGAGKIEFEVTHCANNLTVFNVYVNGQDMGIVNEGQLFSIPTTDGLTLTNIKIDDLGIPFELGDKLVITFLDDILSLDPNAPVIPALELGCEGCVADGTPDVAVVIIRTPQTPLFSHVAATTKKFKGLGQWFTQLLNYNYTDKDSSFTVNAYRNWTIKLAHRTGSLIRPDSLTINTTQGFLPQTAFETVLRRATNTQSIWLSALRIQLTSMGTKKINDEGLFVPAFNGDSADNWTFRIETYNPQHPLIEYYVLDTAGDYQTFYALNKQRTDLAFKRLTTSTALQQTTTPISITGLQNVINFIYGYVDRLENLGWKTNADDFPSIDAETGRNIDWQLEVEKLIDRVYGGMSVGEGHILNPFMYKMNLQTPVGLMSRYADVSFIDAYSIQAAYDVVGDVINIKDLYVTRTDEETFTRSNTPIFSAHVFIDEFEHVISLNQKFADEINAPIIFDSFLGQKIDSAYLNYVKQDGSEGKPTFDGFFLSGNDVQRNITSSISNMGNYYDASKTYSEETTAKHALALLGYTKKDYFTNIGINSTTQFNFWRGLIQAKGTNMTVDAFVNYKKFTDASVDEFWAYKVATYGDARERTFPEVKIEAGDVTQKFTRIQFYDINLPQNPLPQYTQIENTDTARWYSIDDLGKGMKFESLRINERLEPADVVINQIIRLANIYHNGDDCAPIVRHVTIQEKQLTNTTNSPLSVTDISVLNSSIAKIINASMIKFIQVPTFVARPGYNIIDQYFEVVGYTWINPTKLSPIKLFDYKENTLVKEIGLWHPAIGIHSAMPLEIVNMITDVDPAAYNYTTQTVNNQNYKHLKPWGQREVGQVWWDVKQLSYIPYYDSSIFPNRDSRHSRWGALAEWSSVNLYQWTESDVHPSSYDALASSQEGNSSIDKTVRLSGKAANKKYYKRDRIINIRPVAWSQIGGGNQNAHPAFGPAEFTATKISAAGNIIIADKGRVEDLNLITDRHFAAWKDNKPVGEVIIGDVKAYDIGSENTFSVPTIISDIPSIESVRLSSIEDGLFGSRIGAIFLNDKNFGDGTNALRMSDSQGFYEDVVMIDWFSDNPAVDSELVIPFVKFGLNVILTRSTALPYADSISALDLISAASNEANDIFIREAISFTEIIPLPDIIFINNPIDPLLQNPLYSNTEYEWRTWNVPTQSELSSDLIYPRNTWLPYLGDQVVITASPSVVAAISSPEANLSLRSGISINRYNSIWTNWEELQVDQQEIISDGTNYISVNLTDPIDITRLSVYSNGIQVNPSGYVVTGNLIQIVNILPEGTILTILYRAYSPSSSELSFNPDVSDDPSIQTQYKLDYQFTQLEVRDESGNVSGTKYYFWVQDKTIPQPGKNMSLVQAANILTSGASEYTIFSKLIKDTSVDSLGASFDSCAIAGLNYLVTKNNSYKLRFLRNFTLRDDPQELDLKNVHTEWALIRKSQSSKIPKALWDAITNAAAGQDLGGKALPSQTRLDYDSKNGTRTQYGLGIGQIFADSDLVKDTITYTILNTQLILRLGDKIITDNISALNYENSDTWFDSPENTRTTMGIIWNTGRANQINEIFFNVLDDSLACNFEFGDIFKTSLITVSSTTKITETIQQEQVDELY